MRRERGEEGGEGRSMCDRDKHNRDREGDGVLFNIKIPPTRKRVRGRGRKSEWRSTTWKRKNRSDTCVPFYFNKSQP